MTKISKNPKILQDFQKIADICDIKKLKTFSLTMKIFQ